MSNILWFLGGKLKINIVWKNVRLKMNDGRVPGQDWVYCIEVERYYSWVIHYTVTVQHSTASMWEFSSEWGLTSEMLLWLLGHILRPHLHLSALPDHHQQLPPVTQPSRASFYKLVNNVIISECYKVMWKCQQRLKMAKILNKEPAVYKTEHDNFLRELRKFHDSKG